MKVKCISNKGLKDQLTIGSEYKGLVKDGKIFAKNDRGAFGWYDLELFEFTGLHLDIEFYKEQGSL